MKIFLAIPPLTQLNTPYPSTAYLTGHLRQHGYEVAQTDLGIELINGLFTKERLTELFHFAAKTNNNSFSQTSYKIYQNRKQYISTIDNVMDFLKGKDPSLAYLICNRKLLPEGKHFKYANHFVKSFGSMGLADKAKYLSTLYIEDIAGFITENVCHHFELIRYAEKLCTYIYDFKDIEDELNAPPNPVDELMISLLDTHIKSFSPDVVGFSVPFPGNFLSAIKLANHIKKQYPHVTTCMGGGFINTELRELSVPGLFNYTDYVLLDDGEDALLQLFRYIEKKIPKEELVRTFMAENGKVDFYNNPSINNLKATINNCPDFKGLPLDKYISTFDNTVPMIRLWSDGRWNKMMMAHGCYWGKCAFCDTTIPYIKDYQSLEASRLVDNMQKVKAQTGQSGFHFVDEAMPPKLIREMSEELIKREFSVSWWGNIRFEKAFSPELCQLMAKSGCIAVSGGLEVASDRLLKLMNKGVTIEQFALAANNFRKNGILVHTYLMYGFPSQTLQETIDSLEVTRQLFKEGLIKSAFWHRYSMTIHSDSGIHPEKYGAKITWNDPVRFAKNQIEFDDNIEIDLDMVETGLNKATYNFMHGIELDLPVHNWFDEKVPQSKVNRNLIKDILKK